MRNFQELTVWQKGHELTLKIYNITRLFPKEEIYGITSQMRRSSSSIPTNIAEGCGYNSNGEMKRFLTIATGSSTELEYQLILARDLNYIDSKTHAELTNSLISIRRMLYSFIQSLK